MLRFLVFSGLLALAAARESVNVEEVKHFETSLDEKTRSANYVEDAVLDVPEIIAKYGYPVETHRTLTQDGYILELHRIPHGLGQAAESGRVPVFVMHGMFGSSADFIISGPGRALAYTLADAGYDVWLGNGRGNYYSRNHATLNPDDDISFWSFTWEEIGHLDLAASLDYVTAQTGQQRMHYVGHSQGCTTFFVLTSMRPEYNNRIISLQALAPAVFNSNSDRPMLEMIAPYLSIIESILVSRGIAEVFPNTEFVTDLGITYCSDGALTQRLCTQALFAFGGNNPAQHDPSIIPAILGHTPAGASFRQIAHFGQLIASGNFQRYDYGPIQNLIVYGRLSPPDYDLSAVTAPSYIYYGENDHAVAFEDLQRLVSSLPNAAGLFRVSDDDFTHLDFLYGTQAKSVLYDGMALLMRTIERE